MWQCGPYAISYFDVAFVVILEMAFFAFFMVLFTKLLDKIFKKGPIKKWLIHFVTYEEEVEKKDH